jgi:hypothetical protein
MEIQINKDFNNLVDKSGEEESRARQLLPRSTLQNRLAVFWEFRSFDWRAARAGRWRSRRQVHFSIVGNFGSFRSFTAAGAEAASIPGRQPGQFWLESSIITGNVAF